jgi:4-hydroxy-4-methyl-2-oxoglutarate aldolase
MSDPTQILAATSSAAVSDALGSTGVMEAYVRPVWPGARVFGRAYTAACHANSIITVHKALLEASAGDVLVVDAGHDASGALFGGIMASDAQRHGLVGLVTDGAVRDTAHLQQLGFPAFARNITPRVGTNRRIGKTAVPVSCGGVLVRPGDYILADADGVAVIPFERLTEIAEAVTAIADKERGWLERIQAGMRVADLVGFRDAFSSA